VKLYRGIRDASGVAHIYVIEPDKPWRLLDPRTDLFRDCMTGLDWGYSGSAPAQCALAILADALGDDLRAVLYHKGFAFCTIERLPRHLPWEINEKDIVAMVANIDSDMTVITN
jgi:hypothetical protein